MERNTVLYQTLLLCFLGLGSCFLVETDTEGPGHKRGITITHYDLMCADFNLLRGRVSWWHDWEATADYWTTEDRFHGCGDLLENRAAMIWGWPSQNYVPRVPDDAQVVLGFQSPNAHDQSDLQPWEAAQHWPAIMAQAGNRSLVSPGPAKRGNTGDYFQWMDEFIERCHHCRFDYMAAHLYSCNPDADMEFLEHIYRIYNRKIWITEFACAVDNNEQVELNYLKAILPRLEAAPFVARYAWFTGRWNKTSWAVSLLQPDSSTLTPLGEFYLNF